MNLQIDHCNTNRFHPDPQVHSSGK